jgi:hypothetical protein
MSGGHPLIGIRRPVVSASLVLAALPVLAGCGDKGPTAAQAGQQLKADISTLLRHINARDVRVTDDGSRDRPCGKGKAKRTYAVTGLRYIPGETPIGLVGLMVGSFTGDYKLVRTEAQLTTAVMRNKSARTNVILHSSSTSMLTVSGSTDCLRAR